MKKWLKVTACVAVGVVSACSLLLAGCGDDIKPKNDNKIIYNGGIVSLASGKTFFANGVNASSGAISSIGSIDDYNSLKQTARFVSSQNGNVSTISGETAGFSNMYTFAYGDSVYYTTPNVWHKDSSNAYAFISGITLFKVSVNGGKAEEVVSTQKFDTSKGIIKALKYDGYGYVAIYDGSNLTIANLHKKSGNKNATIISDVTSAAIPNENEDWNGKIYYTKNKSGYTPGNSVFEYDFATDKSTDLDNGPQFTVTFLSRFENELFCTILNNANSVTETYQLNTADLNFKALGQSIYTSTISNVLPTGSNGMDAFKGYIYTTSTAASDKVFYKLDNGTKGNLTLTNLSKILFTDGANIFYSTTDNKICYISLADQEEKTVVSDMEIVRDKIGYDFNPDGSLNNIYFYSVRHYDEEVEDDEKDTGIYLYSLPAYLPSGSSITPILVSQPAK